jgi:hypothetical protein
LLTEVGKLRSEIVSKRFEALIDALYAREGG